MNVYELTEKLGGEIVMSKARVRQGNEYIVLGILNGDDMIFTEEGRRLAAEHATEPKPKRSRPAKSDVVELEQVTEDVSFPISEPASKTGLS
jgi:hypothetical protein